MISSTISPYQAKETNAHINHRQTTSIEWNKVFQYSSKQKSQSFQEYFDAWGPLVVHAFQDPWVKLIQIKNHFDQSNRTNQLDTTIKDLLFHPHQLASRKGLSASLISKDHTFSRGNFGIGIRWTIQNITNASYLDSGTIINDPDGKVYDGSRSLLAPSQLLWEHRPQNGYNELSLVNKAPYNMEIVCLFIKTVKLQPVVSRYHLRLLEEISSAHKFEIVLIEDKQSSIAPNQSRLEFYNSDKSLSFALLKNGSYYHIWANRFNELEVSWHKTTPSHHYELIHYEELEVLNKEFWSKLDNLLEDDRYLFAQQVYNQLISSYQQSVINYDPLHNSVKITIDPGNGHTKSLYEYQNWARKTYNEHYSYHTREILPIEFHYMKQVLNIVRWPKHKNYDSILALFPWEDWFSAHKY